jgi:Ca2+-binding RTX toxin-like protein
VKVDLVDPAFGTSPPPPPPPSGSITGTSSDDTIHGTAGNDVISGLEGVDRLYGEAGADTINGGAGSDHIYGGTGADTLTGSGGYDKFVFNTALNSGVDRITDFSTVYDIVRLENAVFTGLSTGYLASSQFYIGAAAHDTTDRIIYNSGTGAVFFDADGTGGAAPVQFALLSTGLGLTASDFYVI